MKRFFGYFGLVALFLTTFVACSSGPSPLAQPKEQAEAEETAKKQTDFFNESPPPASRPGR